MIKNQITKYKEYNKLSLLNYEGDVLRAYHIPLAKCFLIIDDQKQIVESLKKQELIEFLEGKREITTSYGKTYDFSKEHEGAKRTSEEINEFLKLQKDE